MTKRALNPITLATVIVIAYMIMPILSVFISTYITTYAYMLLTVFLVLYIMLTGGLKRLTLLIYLLAPFVVFVVCTLATRNNSMLLWGYQSLLFLLPIPLGYYFLNYRPENMKVFASVIVVAVAATVITTIVGLIRFPDAARALATIAESDDKTAVKYYWNNIGGYSFIYTSVLLYPLLILAYKLRKINLILFLISVVALFTLVILSEYTTALILLILTSILYFVGKKTSAKQLFVFGIIFLLALYFLWPLISNLILRLAGALNSETMTERLTAIAGGLEGIENSESRRTELWTFSLNGFFSSPVFGKIMGASTNSGGHSFILDSLADYGIIGGVTLIFAYRNIYRCFFKPFSDKEGYGFVLWAFVQAIILSTANTGMWLNILTFFIPVLLSVIYKTDSEDYYENSLDS